ncbi:uncharacterized protein LOC119092015 [Pollicipes pollicipes]|uniref:uncharacterized protein LOC119092015 n=1 Tax=Pollicipes pollicipes TaxID=41117 RepID=UPI0018850A14|nr:uncharacterized protein LOC119092015 [Pollicipes pollicipes]
MQEADNDRTAKAHPWSWYRMSLLLSLTFIMILGFVVLGGGAAMQSEYGKTQTRRSVFLCDMVLKCETKRALLHQLMTAWRCDIPAARLPLELSAVVGDGTPSCDSDLLVQLGHGAQGALATGILLVLTSAGGYVGAITSRSGPLALYIVMNVVTTVLEFAAVGLLVYNKSELDQVSKQAAQLLSQPMPTSALSESELLPLLSDYGLLTAPGTIPTRAARPPPAGRRGGARLLHRTTPVAPAASVSLPAVGEVWTITPPAVTATSSSRAAAAAAASSPRPEANSARPEAISARLEASSVRPEANSARPTASSARQEVAAAGGAARPRPSLSSTPGWSGTRRLDRRPRRTEWEDHTEEVIGHWSGPAVQCLLRGAELPISHCFSQLEDNLQGELERAKLVLELMLAPLVCTFLACLLQLTTIFSAWHMISDQQTRPSRPPPPSAQQRTSGV